MSQQPSFIDTQYQFAQAIRDPDNNPAPVNIEPRRMAIYQELFYNNIEGFITNGFPVLREITSDNAWDNMIRDFLIKHDCKSPLFHEISREFLAYLDNERDCEQDPIFMKELAHYEWVELALSISDADIQPFQLELGQDSLSLKLVSSPVAWTFAYHYPVHLIGPDFLPDKQVNSLYFCLFIVIVMMA